MSTTSGSVGDLPSESTAEAESWNMRLYVAGQTPKSLHALVNLNRIDARRLDAAALAFEVVAERGVVRVVSRRGESVAEVAGGPVADTVPDVHRLQEFERGRPVEIVLQAGSV